MSRYLHIPPLFFFFFIIHHVSCQLPSTQLATMNRLREKLQNNSDSSWTSSTNPCSWKGVSCAPNNSSIIDVSLSSFSISNANDSWSSLVCGIETLQSLDLSFNLLTTIPQPIFSACGGLKALNFSNNYLDGMLPSFQGFRSLEVLDLSRNSFDKVIDLQFNGLNELKSLNLSNNKFGGSIPTKLANSNILEELQLSGNFFQGIIPAGITNFLNLTILDLGDNQLTGTIPSGIAKLSKLQLLILSANNLTGEIPLWISEISTLKRFAAYQNNFTGAVPQGITRYLRNLDLSYNKLSGSIPTDLLSPPELQTVDLSSNSLEGLIPSNMSKQLVRLRLGSNRLTGKIPSWSFGNDVPSLTYLEVDHNNLSGMIPLELRNYKNLSLLDLSDNHLIGFLPRELGDLKELQVLQLQNNNFSGEIPDEFSQLQILVKLNISWNSLNGSIPPSFSKLQKLAFLDLQVNNLSGGIPDSFASMDSLLELQLGQNHLGGVVRSLPTRLQISLNLSRNNFQGRIPAALQRVQSLEILDLSHNRFSGEIPSFLPQMTSLTDVVLSDNQLTGPIPTFRSTVILSIDGNNLVNTTSDPSISVPKRKKPVSVGIIAASVAAVVALMIVTVLALILSRRIHKVDHEESPSSQPEIIKSDFLTGNSILRSNLDFTKAMEAVGNPLNVVSKTRFSTYYKAVMPSGMIYFVKKLDGSDKIFQIGSHDRMDEELRVLGKLRNSSVMIPLAYTLTTESVYLYYDFTEKGTLFDVLRSGSGLDWSNRYSIAIGIAHGLAFLHGCPSGQIILLDLSSKVIILKSLNEPQIGDIELSKVIDPSKSSGNLSAVAGSVGYIPPEYAYTMMLTTAGNVYSFGVILLELLTGKAAVSEGSELAKWVSSKSEDNYEQILDSTLSRGSPAIRNQMFAVLKVALACVSLSPEARPKMKSVLRMLLNARN